MQPSGRPESSGDAGGPSARPVMRHLAATPAAQSRRAADILVVDDTLASLEVLVAMLKRAGHRVRAAASGKAALAAVRQSPPELVLLDISMPDMNGYDVCEVLKADEILRGIPVIFISALAEPLDKVKAFAIGGVDYVTKPFQMQELYARVETHLKLRRTQLELEEYSRNLEMARQRLKIDLEWACGVQHALLPKPPGNVPGYEFAAFYKPAYEVGGDYYDFIPLPGNRLAVLVGDVAGKGVAAALLMAKLSSDARFCLLTEPTPDRAFNRLNALMTQPGAAGSFVTLLAAVLDPAEHSVTLVNAGHVPPLICNRAAGKVEPVASDVANVPLGVADGFQYPFSKFLLAPGDCMVAFTDGVTEAMSAQGAQLQTEGISAAIAASDCSPKSLLDRVVQSLTAHTNGRSQHDDITLVAVGRV